MSVDPRAARQPSPVVVGRVVDRDATTATVRVALGGADNLVSYWLPVLVHKTLNDQAYWMPDLDEHVVCLVDARAEWGVVLGAIYSEPTPPPIASVDRAFLRFSDGTEIEYDRAAHRLRAVLVAEGADVEIVTARAVTVTAVGGDVTLNVAAEQHVHVGGAAGQQLATKAFVRDLYNTHTHLSAAPGAPTSPPVIRAPLVAGSDLTKKQHSE